MTLREIVESGTGTPWRVERRGSAYQVMDSANWNVFDSEPYYPTAPVEADARKIVLAVNVLPELSRWVDARTRYDHAHVDDEGTAMSLEMNEEEAATDLLAAIDRELSR